MGSKYFITDQGKQNNTDALKKCDYLKSLHITTRPVITALKPAAVYLTAIKNSHEGAGALYDVHK